LFSDLNLLKEHLQLKQCFVVLFRLDQIVAVCSNGKESDYFGGGGGQPQSPITILGPGSGLKIRATDARVTALVDNTGTRGDKDGEGGGNTYNNTYDPREDCTLIGLRVKYDREVDSLGFYYLCPKAAPLANTASYGPLGGDGGTESNFTCPTGSMITKMNILGASPMTAIQFNCNDTSSTTSTWYGNNGIGPTVTTSTYVISDPSGFYKSLSIRYSSSTIDGMIFDPSGTMATAIADASKSTIATTTFNDNCKLTGAKVFSPERVKKLTLRYIRYNKIFF